MLYSDSLDAEIDRDLGWDSGRTARLRRAARDPILVRLRRSRLFRLVMAVFCGVSKVVFFPVISTAALYKRFDINGNPIAIKRSFLRRCVDGLLVRLLLTPVIIALFFIVLVWQTTHPKPVLAAQTPAARDMYFTRVSLACADGQEIAAWCIPPFSAERVILERDAMMGRHYPAVVIAHGLGFSNEQYLNLAAQMHRAGCTVLMLDTRGQGESPPATITFGVRERLDIAAAVNFVRSLPYTDPARLGVVGYGLAGDAALQAAATDASLCAVVADAVRPAFSDYLANDLQNPWIPASWLVPAYEATFELMVREHLDLLNLAPVAGDIRHAAVLLIARQQSPGDGSAEAAAMLAGRIQAPHRVLISRGFSPDDGRLLPDDTAQVTDFLCQRLHWTAGERSADVQELLKAQVK